MDYLTYHIKSAEVRDIDPANDCLVYVANRFELTMEQRYWLAFLYSTCYCAPTVFYMYNEFPDFENVDVGRLQRWWDKNKKKCVFQTDRRRVQSSNEFVPTFENYKSWVGSSTQQERFKEFKTSNHNWNYDSAYGQLGKIRNVGRFTLFIYLEMVNLLTDFKCQPRYIDWRYAENCKIGLLHAKNITGEVNGTDLDFYLVEFCKKVTKAGCRLNSIFNLETTLCAYAKYKKGQRYIGYYLDRQRKEIDQMKSNVTTGVYWKCLDEFRLETYGKN